jgi:hypothetical protein
LYVISVSREKEEGKEGVLVEKGVLAEKGFLQIVLEGKKGVHADCRRSGRR